MFEEVSEEVSVGVLAQLIQNKPVPQITVVKNTLARGDVSMCESSNLDDDQDISKKLKLFQI